MAEAQLSLDRFWSSTGDARLRPPGRYLDPGEQIHEEGRPRWPSVGELAEAEKLMACGRCRNSPAGSSRNSPPDSGIDFSR
jgi:hypothetical protein